MKNIFLLNICLLLSFHIIAQSGSPIQEKDLLLQAEKKVMDAFVKSKIDNDPAELDALGEQFLSFYKKDKKPLGAYWYAYNCYYQCILQMGLEDKTAAKKILKSGIAVLENLPHKNSEDYALLASMQSISIPLYASIQAIFISGKVKKNGEKALQMDPQNLRAHLVLGSSDFYTPTQYGGGKKVEEYLIKAIKLPAQKVSNPYLPAWGKNTAYELLIRFYLREGRKSDAKAMFKNANATFPNDYQIKSLAPQLID